MPRGNNNTKVTDINIANKVAEARLTLGLSRKQVADNLNITHQQLYKYEKGSNRISASMLSEIAKLFEKPIEYFFDATEESVLPTRKRHTLEVSRNMMKLNNIHQYAVGQLVKILLTEQNTQGAA